MLSRCLPITLVSRNDGIAVTTKAIVVRPSGCVRSGAISAFTVRKGREKFGNAAPEIDGQTQNRAQLDDDGIHLPIAVREADVQQRFREPQVRGRTDGQEFGEAFDNSQDQGEQVVVQSSSEKSRQQYLKRVLCNVRLPADSNAFTIEDTREHRGNPFGSIKLKTLVAGVSVCRDALLHVEDQRLRARGPVALRVLG